MTVRPSSPNITPPGIPPSIKVLEIDPAKVARFKQQLGAEQRFPLAILAGAAAAAVGAILWAMVTAISGLKFMMWGCPMPPYVPHQPLGGEVKTSWRGKLRRNYTKPREGEAKPKTRPTTSWLALSQHRE